MDPWILDTQYSKTMSKKPSEGFTELGKQSKHDLELMKAFTKNYNKMSGGKPDKGLEVKRIITRNRNRKG